MISVAAPAYNEEASIENTLLSWVEYLGHERFEQKWEIVICNDGSTDDTLKILKKFKSLYPNNFKIINFKKNVGAAAALTAAIKGTTNEWVLLNDSDGQFPIENASLFFKKLNNHPSVIGFKGARVVKKDNLFMRIGSLLSGQILNLFYEKSYRDFNSAFMMIKGDFIRAIDLEAKGLNYSTEITAKLAEKKLFLEEININQKERQESVSSKKLIRSALDRLAFVMYLILRKTLISFKILNVDTGPNGEIKYE